MSEAPEDSERKTERTWLKTAKATLKASSKDRITMGAASLAFHWFLAIFPAAVALIAISGLAHLGPHQVAALVHGVDVLLPSQAAQVIAEALKSPARGRAVGLTEAILGALIAIWSSIEAMASLQVGLDLAFETHGDRGFIGRRLMAIPLLGLTIGLGGASFALIVMGHPIANLIRQNVPAIGSVFASVWSVARWPAAILAVGALMSAYYAIGPDRPRLRWRPVTWGSALATLGWFIASFGFEFYLDHFAHETRTYGAFAGVVVLLLWLFLTATMVLAGAELDRQLERPTEAQPGGEEPTEAQPGGEEPTEAQPGGEGPGREGPDRPPGAAGPSEQASASEAGANEPPRTGETSASGDGGSEPPGDGSLRAPEPEEERNPETELSSLLKARIQSLRARPRVDRDGTSY